MESKEVRPLLPDNELIRLFFTKYISNLYQSFIDENPNQNIKTKKRNNNNSQSNLGNQSNLDSQSNLGNQSNLNNNSKVNNKISNFIFNYSVYKDIIKNIYSNRDNFFYELYSTILNYRKIVEKNKNIAQDFYYINTHGGFKSLEEISNFPKTKVPANTILIFLVPINRYGFTSLNEIDILKSSLQKPSNRIFIQENLPCLDKFNNNSNSDSELNTKHLKQYKMFKNALIFYPGQYYFDLKLSFKPDDDEKDMNIYYFTKDNELQKLIKTKRNKNILITKYNDSLSNIVNETKDPNIYEIEKKESKNNFKYIIVNSCRNLDTVLDQLNTNNINYKMKQDIYEYGVKNIYIYENFMFYYNLIMANCNIIKHNTFLPDMRLGSAHGYARYLQKKQSYEKLWIKHYRNIEINFNKFMDNTKNTKNIELAKTFLPEIFNQFTDHEIAECIKLLQIDYTKDMFDKDFGLYLLDMINKINEIIRKKKLKNIKL
jgi:hypothetical protein